MATKKKVRPVVKKGSAGKPAAKKGIAAPKKTTPKAAVKKSSVSTPKKTAPKSATKPAAKAASKTVISKTPAKKSPPAKQSKPAPAAKKVVKSPPAPAKSIKAVPAKNVKAVDPKSSNPTKNSKQVTAPVKHIPAKTVPPKKDGKVPVVPAAKTPDKKSAPVPVKGIDPKKKEQKQDPLHEKAARAIKEMEETMDLSKVRPRIQANGPAPTPAPKQLVHRLTTTPLKLIEPTNTTKIKYQLEFEFRSSPKILFNTLSDSGGLAGWFADEVKTKDNVYTFVWEGGESFAKLVAIKDQTLVRYQWLDDTDGTYFQFEIKEDDITSDVALIITDFANVGERETNIRLWEAQVQKLRMLLGSL